MNQSFTLIDRELPRLLEILTSAAPMFVSAPELRQLSDWEVKLPYIVGGAFRRYVQRVAIYALEKSEPSAEMEAAFAAIERLADSPDPEIENILIVEVFERLELPATIHARFLAKLGVQARKCYDRWII